MLNIIIIAVLSFLFGSVFSTLLLSNMYATKVKIEEEEATQNRGDNMNGLSNIKEISLTRFYRSIASLVLVVVMGVIYGLGVYEVIPEMLFVYVALGLFLAYVLLIDRTITLVHIPVDKWWKDGAPKRAERKETKKADKLAAKEAKKLAKVEEPEVIIPKTKPEVIAKPEPTKTIVVTVKEDDE